MGLMGSSSPWITSAVAIIVLGAVAVASDFFTDLNDVPNPDWPKLKKSLVIGANSRGPAYGSTIRVNRDETEKGSYKNRKIPRYIALHSPTSSYTKRDFFDKMTRWYQEDGNTQVFRLFPGDDNIRSARVNAPRSEIYGLTTWRRNDGWHEWSGRYTFLKVRPGAVFQIKHNSTYWSMQLILEHTVDDDGTYDLFYVKLRDPGAKTLIARDVVGRGIDVKVQDDGENHKVYVDEKLLVENAVTDRPEKADNRARWGLYSPKSAMDRDILIMVTGACVGKSGSCSQIAREGSDGAGSGGGGEWLRSWPSRMKSWLSPGETNNNNYGEEEGSSFSISDVDDEPDPEFLAEWYSSDRKNDGYGYF